MYVVFSTWNLELILLFSLANYTLSTIWLALNKVYSVILECKFSMLASPSIQENWWVQCMYCKHFLREFVFFCGLHYLYLFSGSLQKCLHASAFVSMIDHPINSTSLSDVFELFAQWFQILSNIACILTLTKIPILVFFNL